MSMFSKTCEYGIRALSIIGKYSLEGKKIGIKDLCAEANTPESFTAKILQNLVRRRLIKSQKGRFGGFYIDRDLKDISLKDIVEAIDGNEIFIGCGLGLDKCDSNNPCPLHHEFEVVRSSLNKMCKMSTLSDLVSQLNTEAYER